MRDPNRNVTFAFKCYEKESADLKIRLKYDKLNQSDFFGALLKMYISQDPMILPLVEKIKNERRVMGKDRLKRTKKDYEDGRGLLRDLGITSSDRNHIFDMIEGEAEDYE